VISDRVIRVISAKNSSVDGDEGTELPSLTAAKSEALMDARGLMSAAILEGDDISGRSIEICNETGNVLFILPFADAVKRSR
jgi:hypothetical protein